MRFLLIFSYDGTNYNGFQYQKNLPSIEEELNKALTKINGKVTKITCSGRTDKHVHAMMQCGHVDIEINITDKNLKRALNSNLPRDIHIIKVKKVPNDFHARYNIKIKEYRYYINMDEYNPLERNYVYQYNYKLDYRLMKKAIKLFIGTKDFRAFVTENKEKENCIRTIYYAKINKIGNKLEIIFKGNGFMRYQVRNMVGILIRIGERKLTQKELKGIINSKDRKKSGKTAPPEGLYLYKVIY